MHVESLSIAAVPTDCGCNDDELVFGDEVADAAFFARRLVARMGLDVEFEGGDDGEEEGEEEE